ncbi:hypothetical protein ACFFF5_11775 [Lederbergia wuyishanensis]|uniref:DUF4901 domain-containing protein n=1 Tax=Lederbergia wuyishanensis TaxID=1347903 RepID=A0ABU0D3K8_9BACI|nr:hypothetical protein [Lederbergia wuyishanensis]MCJ8007839.1 hypothetical protein [Lederbergia wuyishanensis]MDQ0342993.1 hypothetical protein [Lederbergia wuyishanensis]
MIQKWIAEIEKDWGLEHFDFKKALIKRDASAIKTTEYKMEMEWFPAGAEMEDESNPPGTIYAEVNFTYGILTSFIVVMSEDSREDPPLLQSPKLDDVVGWVELNIGLKYDSDFRLRRKDKDGDCTEYFFSSIINGRKVSPGGHIEVKVNERGCIVFYSLFGFFHALYPEIEVKHEEDQSTVNMDEIIEKQVVLFGVPEEDGYQLLYGVDEEFIDAVHKSVVLFWNKEDSAEEIRISDKIVGTVWEQFYESQKISEEEMSLNIPHSDCLPISGDENSEFVKVISNYLKVHRPNESGKWQVENIERLNGLLHADVVPVNDADRIVDKFRFLYDANEHELLYVLDKREMLSQMNQLPTFDVKVTKDEALELLEKDIFFEQYYLYDFNKKVLRPTKRIDCHEFVNAVTGEKVRD